MDKNNRHRAISVGSALASIPKYSSNFRRSHSTVTGIAPRTLRVVVLGMGGVGKTAMTVRFVTKRFIGDYDPNLETIYRHSTLVDEQLVNFEIMDTAGQGVNSISLEDKCKWGESFVFVYDVTDRYSFNELTRLKFIASYTHSRLNVNFTPCWILVGNKADLAGRERMVSTEEGQNLAAELDCHFFREISVKESITDASKIFADLWRNFTSLSPRSPSSNQRRKFSAKLQDIPVLDSSSCTSGSDNQSLLNVSSMNEVLVPSLTSLIKGQLPQNMLQKTKYRSAKLLVPADEHFSTTRSPSPRMENIHEVDESDNDALPSPPLHFSRARRNAVVQELPLFNKLPAGMPSDKLVAEKLLARNSTPVHLADRIPSSCCSTSLTSLVNLPSSVAHSQKLAAAIRVRSNSDATPRPRRNDLRPDATDRDRVVQYRTHRHPTRKFNKARFTQSFRNNTNPTTKDLR